MGPVHGSGTWCTVINLRCLGSRKLPLVAVRFSDSMAISASLLLTISEMYLDRLLLTHHRRPSNIPRLVPRSESHDSFFSCRIDSTRQVCPCSVSKCQIRSRTLYLHRQCSR